MIHCYAAVVVRLFWPVRSGYIDIIVDVTTFQLYPVNEKTTKIHEMRLFKTPIFGQKSRILLEVHVI